MSRVSKGDPGQEQVDSTLITCGCTEGFLTPFQGRLGPAGWTVDEPSGLLWVGVGSELRPGSPGFRLFQL